MRCPDSKATQGVVMFSLVATESPRNFRPRGETFCPIVEILAALYKEDTLVKQFPNTTLNALFFPSKKDKPVPSQPGNLSVPLDFDDTYR